MQNAIKKEIKRLCRRTASKSDFEAFKTDQYEQKFTRRTGLAAGIAPPSNPIVDRAFDPAHCARHANILAKTIWYKILAGTYKPHPAIRYAIPKPNGDVRYVMQFAIPDAAVSNVLMRRIRDRNIKRLSASSYAYHPDKNVFDAVIALRNFMKGGKAFSVQIDFRKYFDSIPPRYLKKVLSDPSVFSLTLVERNVIDEFVFHRYFDRTSYGVGEPDRQVRGTPQGSTISLFLANAANHALDERIGRQSGQFARFADDVVALARNYSEALAVEREFYAHCRESGLEINEEKSPGISIVAESDQEIRSDTGFDYLGYRVCHDALRMPDKSIQNIKKKLSRLIDIYLHRYPANFGFDPRRIGNSPDYDWDLLGLIYEMRRAVYGGLSESEIQNFLYDNGQLKSMKGLMGFYSLLEDKTALQELDGWLVNSVRRAMGKRKIILQSRFPNIVPVPLTPNDRELILGTWLNTSAWRGSTDAVEPGLPSFVRGWRAARKYYYTFGLSNVEPPRYIYTSLNDLTSYP